MSDSFDFLVIGSGIAGLYASISLSELGTVGILTKSKLEDSNTRYAQGGVAAVLASYDNYSLHIQDTINAGGDLCDKDNVSILVEEGSRQVKKLMDLGMEFDTRNNEIDFTREGAHSVRRVLHANGDGTGMKISEFLIKTIKGRTNVVIMEDTFVIDLIVFNGKVLGVVAFDCKNKKHTIYTSRAVILASGGAGRVYKNTTNPEVATGDGIALAFGAGAEIQDMEFVQFHPTAFYNPNGKAFLISESLRGEGAILLNLQGERFMKKYHRMMELAPRDIVSRAIMEEISQGSKPYVYIDATHFDEDYVIKRFPTIFETLKSYGVDMRHQLIPVAPAAHYLMGGVKTDSFGRTKIENLYACGEVACTGVHGANRLASNSLLEGLAFSYRIYEDLKCRRLPKIIKSEMNFDFPKPSTNYIDLNEVEFEFRSMMNEYAFVQRDEKGLKKLLFWIKTKLEFLESMYFHERRFWELKNMLTVGMLIVKAALARRESRGAHFRSDYKTKDGLLSKIHIIQSR